MKPPKYPSSPEELYAWRYYCAHVEHEPEALPETPCDAQPGSEARVQTYIERYASGVQLYHSDDVSDCDGNLELTDDKVMRNRNTWTPITDGYGVYVPRDSGQRRLK